MDGNHREIYKGNRDGLESTIVQINFNKPGESLGDDQKNCFFPYLHRHIVPVVLFAFFLTRAFFQSNSFSWRRDDLLPPGF